MMWKDIISKIVTSLIVNTILEALKHLKYIITKKDRKKNRF